MPTVFQTGEREGRPLFPDRLYYTSPQKVADILQIPLPDPVPMYQNNTATHVFISPRDYRLVGFEVGDTIELTSDNEFPHECVITSIAAATSGSNRFVALEMSPGSSNTFDIADNAEVQSLQSFTNGKRKGVTKKQVETLIMRTQDKIDNLTNNSWRPMLQTAEYLNFDTYKPYRRRYYTDYVGSVPLMFRNAQQILRLEIWQGADYREIAAAEIRLKVNDFTQLTANTDKVFLCPGGGGVATLTVGDGASKFRAQFDNVSTAQQLSDLINKDLRKGKAATEFVPSFILEDATETDGTITANVHHEFMASANADYGGGQVKITSMRRGEAGENSTYACTSSGITFSGATDINTKITSFDNAADTITVEDITGFVPFGIINVGNGFAHYTSITGNTLNGITDLGGPTHIHTATSNGATVTQKKFKIDYVGTTTGDEARLRDWWADYDLGVVYFNNSYPYFSWNAVKVSYVYGERYVEKAIEDICTKLVAMDLILSDDRSVLLPEGTQNVDLGSKYQLFKAQVAETLPRYTEVMTVL
tara:strand:+ start:3660 stop:5264 length:1605 start_codon:yes stop_codon:yes gene_type:complete